MNSEEKPKDFKPLYFCGDSHSLPPAWQTVMMNVSVSQYHSFHIERNHLLNLAGHAMHDR
jgi:hypothetical protein